MQKRISNLPFSGTPEQEEKLNAIIARHKDEKGAIMPCLQEAQEVYGYLPVMISAQCIAKTAGRCTHSPGLTFLTDRLGSRFPVKNQCAYCYNVIYNTLPLYLGMQKEEIRRLAPGMLRIQFSIETGEQAGKILDLVRESFLDESSPSAPDFEYTQGHFRRGVS